MHQDNKYYEKITTSKNYNVTIDNLENELNKICTWDKKTIEANRDDIIDCIIYGNLNDKKEEDYGYEDSNDEDDSLIFFGYIMSKLLDSLNPHQNINNFKKQLSKLKTTLQNFFGNKYSSTINIFVTNIGLPAENIYFLEIYLSDYAYITKIYNNKSSVTKTTKSEKRSKQFADERRRIDVAKYQLKNDRKINETDRNKKLRELDIAEQQLNKNIAKFDTRTKIPEEDGVMDTIIKPTHDILDYAYGKYLRTYPNVKFLLHLWVNISLFFSDIQKPIECLPSNIYYGDVYGDDIIIEKIMDTAVSKKLIRSSIELLSTLGIIKYDISLNSKYIYRNIIPEIIFKLDSNDIILIYYPKKTFYQFYNNKTLYQNTIKRILNPNLNYVSFVDAGDNDTNLPLLSLYYDYSENYQYSRYLDFPTQTENEIVTIPGSYLLALHDIPENKIICIGRTIFVVEDNYLLAIKLKKEKENIKEIDKEKKIINWMSTNKSISNIFTYLRGDDINGVQTELANNMPKYINVMLKQQIINSGKAYDLDTTNNEYKYITYYIHRIDLDLSNFIGYINELYKICYSQKKFTEEECVQNVTKLLGKKIETKLDPIEFTRYLEDYNIDQDTYESFSKKSMLNLIQAAKLINNGFVHSSLINMFHNVLDDRRFITTASILDLQDNRRGIGRLSNILQASKFSNFRLIGIADFAEISTLDDFKKSLIKTLRSTNLNNHLDYSMNPDKYVELEALGSQFFSWVVILLRNFILNASFQDIDIVMFKKIIYDGIIIYISTYLNRSDDFAKSLFKELGLEAKLEFGINQIIYFMSKQFPLDVRHLEKNILVEKLIKSKIFGKQTIVTMPNTLSPSELEEYQKNNLDQVSEKELIKFFMRNTKLNKDDYYSRLVYDAQKEKTINIIKEKGRLGAIIHNMAKNQPRGWCTIVFVDNAGNITDIEYLGWFFFLTTYDKNTGEKFMSSAEIQELIGYEFHPATSLEPGKSSVIVINMGDVNRDKDEIIDDIWNKMFPYIDAGAVNGSLPFQDLMNVIGNMCFYSVVLKHSNNKYSRITKRDIDDIILSKYIKIGNDTGFNDLTKNELINHMWTDLMDLVKNTVDTEKLVSIVKSLNHTCDAQKYSRKIIMYNLRLTLLLKQLGLSYEGTLEKIDIHKFLYFCNGLLETSDKISTINLEQTFIYLQKIVFTLQDFDPIMQEILTTIYYKLDDLTSLTETLPREIMLQPFKRSYTSDEMYYSYDIRKEQGYNIPIIESISNNDLVLDQLYEEDLSDYNKIKSLLKRRIEIIIA